MKTFLLFVTIIAITGCSTYLPDKNLPDKSFPVAAAVAAADPISVRECRPVGIFPGPYGYRFWGPPPVLADFKSRTAMKAREAGATHIYWREDVRGYYGE